MAANLNDMRGKVQLPAGARWPAAQPHLAEPDRKAMAEAEAQDAASITGAERQSERRDTALGLVLVGTFAAAIVALSYWGNRISELF